jgi:hypothetical protein
MLELSTLGCEFALTVYQMGGIGVAFLCQND